MEQIKETIANVIQELTARKTGVARDDPAALLKKVLTKRELAHIKFHYFRKGVLGLYVDSSGWLYNLNLKKEDLLRRIGARLEKIKDIRFRLGEIK